MHFVFNLLVHFYLLMYQSDIWHVKYCSYDLENKIKGKSKEFVSVLNGFVTVIVLAYMAGLFIFTAISFLNKIQTISKSFSPSKNNFKLSDVLFLFKLRDISIKVPTSGFTQQKK